MRAELFAFASLVFVAIGCGSSPSSSLFDQTGDGAVATESGGEDSGSPGADSSTTDSSTPSTDSSTPGTDTAPADTGPTPTTLDNVCDRLANAVCTKQLQTCCTSRGVTYGEGGCHDAVKTSCDDKVAAVMAGDMTFDGSAFAACAAAWSTLEGKCSVPILDYVKTAQPCQQLFNGKVAPGSSCTDDSDCHANVGQWVRCATDGSGVCNAFTVPSSGKPCGYTSATAAICDYGLACNYMSMSTGTCKTAKSLGATCNQDYECGFGNYCQKTPFGGASGSCAAGLPQGSGCSASAQCASGSCRSGSCSDPNFELAIPALCSGG